MNRHVDVGEIIQGRLWAAVYLLVLFAPIVKLTEFSCFHVLGEVLEIFNTCSTWKMTHDDAHSREVVYCVIFLGNFDEG